MRRSVVLAIGLAVVVAAAMGGWILGRQIESPADVAAEAEPPPPSLITVPVERTVITNAVVTRGTVRFDNPRPIVVAAPPLPGVAPIVTAVADQGELLEEGDILYELAGRPSFLLEGDLPLFRPLSPGDEGEDIAQLQRALARLGFDPGPIDGGYGPLTMDAVTAFYAAHGYEPVGPLDEEQQAVELARHNVAQAQAVLNAEAALRTEIVDRKEALNLAEAHLDAAELVAESSVQRFEAALSGVHPDTGLPPTEDELAALGSAAFEAGLAVETATEELAAAELAAVGVGGVPSLGVAQAALDAAKAQLADAQARIGIHVPATELLFFPSFPIRVDSVAVARGDVAQGEIMTVSGDRLAIDSEVDVKDADNVAVGASVEIDLTSRNISLTGVITRKADRPGTDGVDGQAIYIEVVPDEFRPDLNNANVRITIPVESTGGEVLAVPAAAISATAGGDSIVTVLVEGTETRTVSVRTGLSVGGMVEVTPIDGALAEDDRVVVGQ